MLLLAAALKNPGRPFLRDAAVWVQGNVIRFAGSRSDLPPEALQEKERIEAPGSLIIPGLVNAHSHLELTALNSLPYPGSFTGWIRAVLAAKNHLDDSLAGD